MQKLPSVFLLGALLLSGTAAADEPVQPPYGHDSNPDACGAVLCLLGMTRDGDCDKYIQKYFSIKRYKHGHFSPSRTKAARGEAVESLSLIHILRRTCLDAQQWRSRSIARALTSWAPLAKVA